jgi:gas vesicle protein
MRQAADYIGGSGGSGGDAGVSSALAFAPAMAERIAEGLYNAVDALRDDISDLAASISEAVSSILPIRETSSTTTKGVLSDAFAGQLATIGENMSAFIANANAVMAQMGMATNALYSTTNNAVYNNSYMYDQKSTFNINDTSGQPQVTAQMIDTNQSMRIRNMRGAFS